MRNFGDRLWIGVNSVGFRVMCHGPVAAKD